MAEEDRTEYRMVRRARGERSEPPTPTTPTSRSPFSVGSDAGIRMPPVDAFTAASAAAGRFPRGTERSDRVDRVERTTGASPTTPEWTRAFAASISGQAVRAEHGPNGVCLILPGDVRIMCTHRDAENLAAALLGIGERSDTP